MSSNRKSLILVGAGRGGSYISRTVAAFSRRALSSTIDVYPLRIARNVSQATNIDEFAKLWMPYEEHIRELATLKLLNSSYTVADYASALERELRIKIEIRTFSEVKPGQGIASLEYDEYSATATIWVPNRLSWWLAQYAMFHELGHLAAGHSFIRVDMETKEKSGRYAPVKRRLARKAPPSYEDLPNALTKNLSREDMGDVYEAECEVRAQHNMLTAQLGGRALELDGLNQSA